MTPTASSGKTVVIAGGRGAIGQVLTRWLHQRHYRVAVLTRRALPPDAKGICYYRWDGKRLDEGWIAAIAEADAVVNLAGKSIFTLWTQRVKQELWDSRVQTTQLLATAIQRYAQKPLVFLSVSAIGYYGDLGERECDERCGPGTDFLAKLCVAWERAALSAGNAAVRVVIPRIGIVLQRAAGFFALIRHSYRYGLCLYPGNGQQWLSWIHIQDLVRSIEAALVHPWDGVYNAVAPNPVRLREFIALLAARLHRCRGIRIPAGILRTLGGEAAMLALSSQRIRPAQLSNWNFSFHYPSLQQALDDLLG